MSSEDSDILVCLEMHKACQGNMELLKVPYSEDHIYFMYPNLSAVHLIVVTVWLVLAMIALA